MSLVLILVSPGSRLGILKYSDEGEEAVKPTVRTLTATECGPVEESETESELDDSGQVQ